MTPLEQLAALANQFSQLVTSHNNLVQKQKQDVGTLMQNQQTLQAQLNGVRAILEQLVTALGGSVQDPAQASQPAQTSQPAQPAPAAPEVKSAGGVATPELQKLAALSGEDPDA
jgi:hypothetical protein